MSAALKLSNLSFSWSDRDRFGLQIESFGVESGEKLLLRGPSGSGKSTLLSLICGIVPPRSGTIEVVGTDIAKLRGAACDRFRSEHFGVIFQLFNLLPYGSVVDNVLLPLSFARKRRARVSAQGSPKDEARRLLSRLGIDDDLHERAAASLSVGQQQRVAVARALIGRPEIVIADEPTSSLDRDHRSTFLELLFEEVARADATLILVSHDDAVQANFDRVVELASITAEDAES